jgi:hypothetical protein
VNYRRGLFRLWVLNHVWFESGSSRGVGEAARIPI